ncbi:hypothetical protein NQZ68_018293 [Dissostichus eleginoides]|nr:hypothetical protein NQZ68_018293 [Dissostichus eleginoides]
MFTPFPLSDEHGFRSNECPKLNSTAPGVKGQWTNMPLRTYIGSSLNLQLQYFLLPAAAPKSSCFSWCPASEDLATTLMVSYFEPYT